MPRYPLLVAAAALGLIGCRSVAPAFGTESASDAVLGSVAMRFDRVFREPKVRAARRLITRGILTPSKIFGDTAIWMWSPEPTVRATAYRAVVEPNRYRFTANGDVSTPKRAGEARHDIRLRRLTESEYEWTATSDFALGSITPTAFANIPVAWIASGERADSAALRADAHTAFRRSTREWGHVFSVASFDSRRDADGAWRQRRVIVMEPERATRAYPKFGAWLRKYVGPMRIRMRLRDSTRTWFDFTYARDTMIVTTRSVGGKLVPFEGGMAPLPDTVALDSEFSVKVSVFRASALALRAQFITIREPNRRGWLMRFTQEPRWDLPLFTESMIRTPLRRPFAGAGSSFTIFATHDRDAGQTLLSRRTQVPVQESAILRFLATLANAGVGDYVDGADTDTNRWLAAAFAALRDDSRAILGAETHTPSR